MLPRVLNLRLRLRLPNSDPASERLSLDSVKDDGGSLIDLCRKALRWTGGDSTFSLSMLKVSRISSFLKCSMVSAMSLALPPRFLVKVSFKCSRRLFGVVVLKERNKMDYKKEIIEVHFAKEDFEPEG